MKNIEPGCLAVIIKADRGKERLLGLQVTVGLQVSRSFFSRATPVCPGCRASMVWRVEPSVGIDPVASCGCSLMRIDGHEADEKEQFEALTQRVRREQLEEIKQ